MQQPLIQTWATIPLDWIQIHPKPVPSSFLGEDSPTRDYQWVLQVLQTYFKQK
jgi:hypothetical protein